MIVFNSGNNKVYLNLSDKIVYNNNNILFTIKNSLTKVSKDLYPVLDNFSNKFYEFSVELVELNQENLTGGTIYLQTGYYDIYVKNYSGLEQTTILELRGRVIGPGKTINNIGTINSTGLEMPEETFCQKVSNCDVIQEIETDIINLENNKLNISDFNIYSANTNNLINNKVSKSGDTISYLEFDLTGNTNSERRLVWNDADGTLNLGLKGGNVSLQIGQEQVIRIVNKTNSNLLESEYKVCRVRLQSEGGAQGQRLAIVLAQANNDNNSVDTLGVVTENINNNQEGFITTFGEVRGINTTGSLQGETWLDGDVLYLSPTTPGNLTKIKPQAPNHQVVIGYVSYAHQNNGKIFVKIQNGYELDELHNVKISGLTNNDVLIYDGSELVWKNSNILATNTNNITNLQNNKFDKSGGTITGVINLQQLSGSTAPLGVSGGTIVALNRSGLYSARPSTPFIGQMYFATDIGTNGTIFVWNGSIWRADNPITYLDNTTYTTAEISGGVVVKSQLIPAGILQPNSIIEVEVLYQHTYVSGNQLLLRGFLETTNTGQTNTIYTAGVSATNALQTSMTKQIVNRNSLTSQLIRYSTNGLLAIAGSQATTALPTLSLNTANDLYFNFTINRNNGNTGNTANLVMTKILIYQ